jgi:hypothetical protein
MTASKLAGTVSIAASARFGRGVDGWARLCVGGSRLAVNALRFKRLLMSGGMARISMRRWRWRGPPLDGVADELFAARSSARGSVVGCA